MTESVAVDENGEIVTSRRLAVLLAVGTLAATCCGCASVAVTARYTPVMGVERWREAEGSHASVVVWPFQDGRTSQVLGYNGPHAIETAKDIPAMCNLAAHDALQRSGVDVYLSEQFDSASLPPRDKRARDLRGRVVQYGVSVEPHFMSSTLRGNTVLEILVSEDNEITFSRSCSGESALSGGVVPVSASADVLDEALQQSAMGMLEDEEFRGVLLGSDRPAELKGQD